VDDKTKAKALMAAGLFVLAIIGLAVVLVVLPAIHSGSGGQRAFAQGAPGAGAPPAGPAPGAPGAAGAPAGIGGPPGAAPAGGPGAAAAAGRVVEPLEKSRPNPFGAYTGAGLLAARPAAGLAFSPSYHTMTVGVFQEHAFPIKGSSGQSIKVPAAPSLRRPGGPAAPPEENVERISTILYDQRGKAMVILQPRAPGQQGQVLQVGDRYKNDWRVESITRTQMVLSRIDDPKVKRTVRLMMGAGGTPTGGAGRTAPGAPAGGGQPRGPGMAVPGGQPGAGGGAQPGGFPGVRRGPRAGGGLGAGAGVQQ
jgi:hypothetical protein